MTHRFVALQVGIAVGAALCPQSALASPSHGPKNVAPGQAMQVDRTPDGVHYHGRLPGHRELRALDVTIRNSPDCSLGYEYFKQLTSAFNVTIEWAQGASSVADWDVIVGFAPQLTQDVTAGVQALAANCTFDGKQQANVKKTAIDMAKAAKQYTEPELQSHRKVAVATVRLVDAGSRGQQDRAHNCSNPSTSDYVVYHAESAMRVGTIYLFCSDSTVLRFEGDPWDEARIVVSPDLKIAGNESDESELRVLQDQLDAHDLDYWQDHRQQRDHLEERIAVLGDRVKKREEAAMAKVRAKLIAKAKAFPSDRVVVATEP